MRRSIRQIMYGICLCGTSAMVPATADPAADSRFHSTLTLASDYVFRGVSQTVGGPAVQAGLDAHLAGAVTVYGWASSVDFTESGEPDDGADVELDLGISVSLDLDAGGVLDVGVVRYLFPGVDAGIDYDYSEFLLTWTPADRVRADLAYSRNVFASGEPGLSWQLGLDQPLPLGLSMSIAYGRYQLEQAYGGTYGFGSATLARSYGPATVTLGYYDTSAGAAQLFTERSTGSRLVAALSIDLF